MTITTNQNSFTEAQLVSRCNTRLYAKFIKDLGDFEVSMDSDYETGFYYEEEDCREAAEFFIKLADELKRRKEEAK